MLPKRNRLGRSQALRECLRRGRRISAGGFSLKILRTGPPSRFAISVSAKSAKRATDRNRMRRQLFGILEEQLATFHASWLVYISVFPQAFRHTHEELRTNFLALLYKAHL